MNLIVTHSMSFIRRYLLAFAIAVLMVACGDGDVSGVSTGGGNSITQVPSLALLAGNMGGPGNADGTGPAASFNSPYGVATDNAGNLYVADSFNNTIRKITPAGKVTTLAGTPGTSGSADGVGPAASFNSPYGVATDNAGNLYVADINNNTIRKIVLSSGMVTTLAGTAGTTGSVDGTGPAASFNGVVGVATDNAGNLYVTDSYNNTIRKIVLSSGMVTTLAGSSSTTGSADGTGATASFNYPEGVATDSSGNLYVADTGNKTIRQIVVSTGVVTTLAGTAGGTGHNDGTGPAASFDVPAGVATDSAGNLYVTDYVNSTIRKITPATGVVTTLVGTAGTIGHADGTGAAASFNYPEGIATNSAGNLYVADYRNNTIRKITPEGVVTTVAGSVSTNGSADGTGTAASFNGVFGVANDSAGNLYVADTNNSTIREITPEGVVTTLAGTAGTLGHADGTGAAASFNIPIGLATDSAGNLYVADSDNHTIRKIVLSTGVVTTLAGEVGIVGSADGTGAAARFDLPQGVATDNAGNLYVADTLNNTIRKIVLSTGVVTTLAGTAGTSGSADGTGAAANFNYPTSVATDNAGNLYVADTLNGTIRKIVLSTGVVTTLAGSAGTTGHADGIGAAASFESPYGIAIDDVGSLYVADTGNNTIRKINPSTGVVTTLVGKVGRYGFVPGPLPSVINSPLFISVFGGALYFSADNGIAVVSLP